MSPEQIAAITGLVAVVVSPLVAFYTIRRQGDFLRQQLHADVVLISRREWLRELRDSLAEYVSVSLAIGSGAGVGESFGHTTKYERLNFVRSKILLLLNPTEPLHSQLVETLDEALVASVQLGPENIERLAPATNDVIRSAQRVLKAEWEVIKTLESPNEAGRSSRRQLRRARQP